MTASRSSLPAQEWYEEHAQNEESQLLWQDDEQLLNQPLHPRGLRQRAQTII